MSGEIVNVGNDKVALLQVIEIGHKVAYAHLSEGEKIIRYGVAIGSATKDIVPGEHVHKHNMKSDYIAPTTSELLKEISDFK